MGIGLRAKGKYLQKDGKPPFASNPIPENDAIVKELLPTLAWWYPADITISFRVYTYIYVESEAGYVKIREDIVTGTELGSVMSERGARYGWRVNPIIDFKEVFIEQDLPFWSISISEE